MHSNGGHIFKNSDTNKFNAPNNFEFIEFFWESPSKILITGSA